MVFARSGFLVMARILDVSVFCLFVCLFVSLRVGKEIAMRGGTSFVVAIDIIVIFINTTIKEYITRCRGGEPYEF